MTRNRSRPIRKAFARLSRRGYGPGTSRGLRNWKTDHLSGRRRPVGYSNPTNYRACPAIRYEMHSDRKLERTLAMLLRIQYLLRETGGR